MPFHQDDSLDRNGEHATDQGFNVARMDIKESGIRMDEGRVGQELASIDNCSLIHVHTRHAHVSQPTEVLPAIASDLKYRFWLKMADGFLQQLPVRLILR